MITLIAIIELLFLWTIYKHYKLKKAEPNSDIIDLSYIEFMIFVTGCLMNALFAIALIVQYLP